MTVLSRCPHCQARGVKIADEIVREGYRDFLMASVDSQAEKAEAIALGWRTFRVRAFDELLHLDEVICPASDEAGHSTTCLDCQLCRGTDRPARSVAIFAHGQRVKWFGSTMATA